MQSREELRAVIDRLDANLQSAVRVRNVSIKGNSRTSETLFAALLAPLSKVRTVNDLLVLSGDAVERLERLDIFEHCKVHADAGPAPGLADLVVDVREKGFYRLTVGQVVGIHDSGANLSLALRNVFGEAETLSLNAFQGTQTASTDNKTFQLEFTKPVLDPEVDGKAFKIQLESRQHNFLAYASHAQTERSATVSYTSPLSNIADALYEVAYTASWREISNLPAGASLSIRREAGHSLKSSFKHLVLVDRRDRPVGATQGYSVRAESELAGLLGDARFLRHEVRADHHTPLRYGASLAVSGSAGFVQSLAQGGRLHIADRLFLGGSPYMRGFRSRSFGPRDRGDTLGGSYSFNVAANLYLPLPVPERAQDLKGLLFANVGHVGARGDHWMIADCVRNARASVGVGIAIKTPIGELSVSYALPLRTQSGDKLHALQFGIQM